nr:MAG TPA: hypothetical protein [Caudoviricetes sp.]
MEKSRLSYELRKLFRPIYHVVEKDYGNVITYLCVTCLCYNIFTNLLPLRTRFLSEG